MDRGKLITFEGGDGVGKTTQVARLVEFLAACDLEVVATREPGGTALGREIRRLLVSDGPTAPVPRAELFLYLADRAQHVDAVVRPALERGAWVVCDRFVDSTIVYQGAGRGLDEGWLEGLCRAAVGDVWPDLTLWLAAPPAVTVERLARRGDRPDRFEAEGEAFQDRLFAAFARRAAGESGRWRQIDSSPPVDAVAAAIAAAVVDRYPQLREAGR